MKAKTITIPVEFCVRWTPDGRVSSLMHTYAHGARAKIIGAAWEGDPLVVAPHYLAPLVAHMLKAAEDSTDEVVTLDKYGAEVPPVRMDEPEDGNADLDEYADRMGEER